MKNKEHRQGDASKSRDVIPPQPFAEIGNGEDREDGECDDFLNRFELRGREFVRTNAVCGDLETIFKESDAPTDEDHLPQGGRSETSSGRTRQTS